MIDDPIVEEVRRIREEFAAKHDHDVHKIAAALRRREKKRLGGKKKTKALKLATSR